MLGLNKNITFAVILAVLIALTIIVIQFFPINEQEENNKSPQSFNPAQSRLPARQAIEQITLAGLKTDSLGKALAKFNTLKQSEKREFIESFLSRIDTRLLQSLVTGGMKTLPAEQQKFIAQVFAEISGLPPNTILYQATTANLSAIFGLKTVSENSPVTISFTAAININNSPQNPREAFTQTESQIFACFPNEKGLKGLRYIKVKWIHSTPANIIYEGYKLIDPDKPYNFVWMRNSRGWGKGRYEVSIFNLAGTCLAKGGYEIK
jgi:hypothetical protein